MTSMVLTHGRYQFLETVRVPIALFSALLFPSLSMVFFVSASGVGADPLQASTAVAQLCVFAILSTWVFNIGITVAEERAQPWDAYLRTLPAGPWPRIAGRVLSAFGFGIVALLPLVVLAWLTTTATASVPQVLAAGAVLLLAGIPILFLALLIGYSMPSKAAVAVAQLTAISVLLPTRGGRDLVVWVLTSAPPSGIALVSFAVWTVLLAFAAAWAYRREEGRRFR